ncbi:MAG: hypothetical protein IKB21_03940 [Clostridia bacterium]|nr:hypothetical protein [Clostridia bacterium]
MYLWSWTFLIIPAAILVGAVVAGFAIKAIARKVKRKAAAQKAAKQANGKQKDKTPEKTINPEKTTEAVVAQQPAPVAEAQVQKQTTDVVAPNEKLSDAEYIKQIVALPFDAKDNEIVMKDKQKHTEWLIATQKLNDPKSSDAVRAQAENALKELNQYFECEYGHIPTMPSPANYAATVQDENGKIVYDFRNYCFDGNGAKNFQQACEEKYRAQDYDDLPTIFQVDIENHPSLVVSSTQEDMFKAGVKDIETTMKAQNINDCTFHLVTDENGRQLISQKGTVKDINAFIEKYIPIKIQEDELEK